APGRKLVRYLRLRLRHLDGYPRPPGPCGAAADLPEVEAGSRGLAISPRHRYNPLSSSIACAVARPNRSGGSMVVEDLELAASLAELRACIEAGDIKGAKAMA